MPEKIVSFIPIKLNNQRLPGKNLLPLHGKPACAYLFDVISQVRGSTKNTSLQRRIHPRVHARRPDLFEARKMAGRV